MPDPAHTYSVRTVSNTFLALGGTALALGLWRGLSYGALLEAGSNNRIAVILGIVLVAGGILLRLQSAAARLELFLRRSTQKNPAALARLESHALGMAQFGLWLGLITGVVESTYRAYLGVDAPWPHSYWLGPLTYGVLLGIVGLAFTSVSRLRRNPLPVRVALSVFLTVTLSAWLFVATTKVHVLALVVLAAGIATQLSQRFARQPYLTSLVVAAAGRTAALIVASILVLMLTVDVSSSVQASANAAPATGGHSVLLIVLDTVGASHLSVHGYDRKTTPNLERWSRRAIVFESAMATASWTLPSHAGIFTGRWTDELGSEASVKLPRGYPTIAEVMRHHGYSTAGFVGNLLFTTQQSGLARGFDHYEDFRFSAGEALLSTSIGRTLAAADWLRNATGYQQLINRKKAPDISRSLQRWLKQNGSQPFFAFLNYYDAHEPYLPGEQHARLFRNGAKEPRGPYAHGQNSAHHADWSALSAGQVAQEKSLYDASISSLDHELGQLLDGLDAQGVLSRTVVIITSDHGEAFGENGLFEHGNSLYLSQLHVPLLVLVPGLTESNRVHPSVSLREIPITILDLAKVRDTSSFPGASLARYWRKRDAVDSTAMTYFMPGQSKLKGTPLARGNMRSVIADPFHYILNGDGIEELFNYRQDPLEQRNLADSPAASSLLPRLRARLQKPVK